jgi:hypothetical protein
MVKLHNFNGDALTVSAISERSGLSVTRVRDRLRARLPPERAENTGGPRRYEYDGQMLTADAIGKIVGVTANCVRRRARSGEPLGGPACSEEDLTASGEREVAPREEFENLFDDNRPYIFDLRARHAWNYFQRGEIVSTDEEIRAGLEGSVLQKTICEQFGPTARLNAAGIAWVREQMRAEMFILGKPAFGETLEFVGDMLGVCRERIRQIEARASAAFRRNALRLGLKDSILDELRERDARRRETHQQQMERIAPSDIDLSDWVRTHSMAKIARRSGRDGDVSAAMAASGKRGGKAMRGRSRRKAA